MGKIITITLNPALDKSIVIYGLVPEKKLRCSEAVLEPGGGGINVTRAIHKLGGQSKAMYLAGGYTGEKFTELIKAENIDFEVFRINEDTRENFIAVDANTNLQYRFGMEGPFVSEAEWLLILKAIDKEKDVDFIVASGSLPPGVPLDFFGRLATISKEKNAKLIVDTSGAPLQKAVEVGVFLCKPNLSELTHLVGKEQLKQGEIMDAARSIIAKGGCEIVVVSLGAKGAIMVSANEHYEVKAPKVEVHSTVGAGDSMVAGILMGLAYNNWSLKEVLCYGIAAGTSATMGHGTELCNLEATQRIFEQLKD
jgi:6-phosphofructokinase 2